MATDEVEIASSRKLLKVIVASAFIEGKWISRNSKHWKTYCCILQSFWEFFCNCGVTWWRWESGIGWQDDAGFFPPAWLFGSGGINSAPRNRKTGCVDSQPVNQVHPRWPFLVAGWWRGAPRWQIGGNGTATLIASSPSLVSLLILLWLFFFLISSANVESH